MKKVNIHEAKTQLSKLIASGEEIVIARKGEPVARLVPIRPPARKRVPGSAAGAFAVPAEFFEPLPEEILNGFEVSPLASEQPRK
jgi:prevent-host-death family protein